MLRSFSSLLSIGPTRKNIIVFTTYIQSDPIVHTHLTTQSYTHSPRYCPPVAQPNSLHPPPPLPGADHVVSPPPPPPTSPFSWPPHCFIYSLSSSDHPPPPPPTPARASSLPASGWQLIPFWPPGGGGPKLRGGLITVP